MGFPLLSGFVEAALFERTVTEETCNEISNIIVSETKGRGNLRDNSIELAAGWNPFVVHASKKPLLKDEN